MKSTIKLMTLVVALGLAWAGAAQASQVNPPPAGFLITGFIQEATLDGTVAGQAAIPKANTDPLAGGTITVNGIKVLVPNNMIVQFPAAAFTWQQVFDPAISAPINVPGTPARQNHRPGISGLALADNPLQGTRAVTAAGSVGYPSYQVTVMGNIKYDVAGNPTYIAGMILPASQNAAGTMSGIINFIDYNTGRFRVGGIIGNPLSGTLCEINDPATAPDGGGRFGLRHSPDPRFCADTNNPTITTNTGYPVGIPRPGFPLVNGIPNDPTRPVSQRPLNNSGSIDPNQPFDPFLTVGSPLRTYFMPASGAPGTTTPDPWKQIPLMVGDFVTYTGTTFKINPLGPNTAANMYISVNTLIADLGVYTQPRTIPVYVSITDKLVFGTDGSSDSPNPNVAGPAPGTPIPAEFATRVQVVGFCTDAGTISGAIGSALVYIYAVNNPTGTENFVFVPNSIKAGQPTRDNPASVEAIPLGRFRIQPGKINFYLPPITNTNNIITREYRVVHSTVNPSPGSDSGSTGAPPVAPVFPAPIFACNGLPVGFFQAPNFEYLTPEHTTIGSPVLPNNFQDFPFLATGDNYAGFQLSRLDPWPGPF